MSIIFIIYGSCCSKCFYSENVVYLRNNSSKYLCLRAGTTGVVILCSKLYIKSIYIYYNKMVQYRSIENQ